MQLLEMETRGWWVIEDDATNPSEITAVEMIALINQAVQDMGQDLNIVKPATISLTANVGALPSDFIAPVRMEDADAQPITQIKDINEKDSFSQCWYATDYDTFTVYPTTEAETSVTLYYQAKPAALSGATDEPSDIPLHLHHYIPEVYVKGMYALKRNNPDEYVYYMRIWDDVKAQARRFVFNKREALADHSIVDVYGGVNP